MEEREALARAANRANVDFTERWGSEMPKEAIAAAKKAGLTFVEVDPALQEASEAFGKKDVQNAIDRSRDQFGLADADQRVHRFLDLVDKWTKIVDGADNDPAKIAKATQDEIWSKVDFKTYGM